VNAARSTAIGALALSLVLYALGYFVTNREAYLFPRLIAIGMSLCALAILVSEWRARPGKDNRDPSRWTNLLPALGIFAVDLLIAEDLGFYASSLAAFFALASVYAPDRISARAALKRMGVALLFTAAMYSIFALLLKVQTPRGLLN